MRLLVEEEGRPGAGSLSSSSFLVSDRVTWGLGNSVARVEGEVKNWESRRRSNPTSSTSRAWSYFAGEEETGAVIRGAESKSQKFPSVAGS